MSRSCLQRKRRNLVFLGFHVVNTHAASLGVGKTHQAPVALEVVTLTAVWPCLPGLGVRTLLRMEPHFP